jgi:molybdopterin/thiamine biosynthesis adenylyltransferase
MPVMDPSGGYSLTLTPDEEERYSRQTAIPNFGPQGQQRLREAKVLIAGLGGLGTPASLYLAAAGVGALRLVDFDVIQLNNLNRQLLYGTKDVGQRKTPKAHEHIHQLNPHVDIETVDTEITPDNVLSFTADCDLIIDALDNYSTRYALNEAAISSRIPFIHGSIHALDGIVTTIVPGSTPCLRCIFPEPPPPTTTPVLGATPGVIGCIQALEAIKYLTGLGELLTGRLLLFDGLDLKFRELRVKRDPRCLDCQSA